MIALDLLLTIYQGALLIYVMKKAVCTAASFDPL